MRCGVKVLNNIIPVEGAKVTGNIIPNSLSTDKSGEAFFIAPMFLSPSNYYLNINVTSGNISFNVEDLAFEISNYYIIDIGTKKWFNIRLNVLRMTGDGFYLLDHTLLKQSELMMSNTDPMMKYSNCSICRYYIPSDKICAVNGKQTPYIKIDNPSTTTSRLYYPIFLFPSEQRIKREYDWYTKTPQQ